MRSLLFLPLAFLALTPVFAQRTPAPARLLAPISPGVVTRLTKDVPSPALARFDTGMAPANARITGARLVLARTPAQQQALNAYIAGEMNPASPDYHKWLTPQQFGERYGLNPADIAKLVGWLQSRGFTVSPVPAGRDVILFSGSVANIEATFQVHVHQFTRNERSFLSNVDAPSIPSALAPAIQAVAGLGTNGLHPLVSRGEALTFDPQEKKFIPEFTFRYGPDYLGLTPGDWATIYNAPNQLNANFGSSSGATYTGSGVTIGVVGDANIDLTTIENYRKLFLGEDNQPTIVAPPALDTSGSTNSANSIEAFLDLEISGGLAPGANLIYYEDYDPVTAIMDAVNDNQADIISISWGTCEAEDSGVAGFYTLTQQAAAQGQAVVVATGDNGSDDCDQDSYESAPGTSGFGVNVLASTEYNVAVGGSDLYALSQNFNEYVSSTVRSDYSSVVGYIPESPWNNSIMSPTTIAENAPDPSTDTSLASGSGAGEGGVSTLVAKPAWQTGPGVPNDGMRDLPDVSMFAGNGADGAATVVCDDEPSSSTAGAPVDDCAPNSQGQFLADGRGGTSVAAPAFAGILALVEQKTGGRLGNAVEELYALYNSKYGPTVFHDITTGNNSVPCKEGTPDCALNAAGYYYLTGYNAGPGYDLATGLGSVNITNLVNDWGATSSSAPNLLSASMSSKVTSGALDDDLPITIAVSVAAPVSTDPAPTGTITISATGYTSSATTLASGSASITIPSGTFQPGSTALTIAYSGDSNYDPNSMAENIVILQPPTVTLKAATVAAIAPGATAQVGVSVQSANGYTGTLTLGCSLASSPANAVSAPSCVLPAPIGLTDDESTTTTVSFTTTSGTQSKNNAPLNPFEKGGLGTALAAVLLLTIPSKNRAWRNLLCALLVVSVVGLMTACGGKGSSGPPTPPTPPTTAGTYTYTIQGSGNPALTVQPVTTVSITVN